MDEFINDDITNRALSGIVNNLPQELFPDKSDEVKLFNEMYYQMTRFIYEEPEIEKYKEYKECIIRDMGWHGYSDLVLVMMYTYFRIREKQPKPFMQIFMAYMEKNFGWSYYWPHFINFTSSILRYPPSKFDPKVPHPVPAKELIGEKLDFEKITCSHNFESIQEIVNLWTDEKDKKIMAKILLDDVRKYSSSYIKNHDEIKNWLESIIDDENKKQVIELQKRLDFLVKENEELKKKIKELEGERKSDHAFNSKTSQPCFTSRQMGILMTAVGKITEKGNSPSKTNIGDVVENIAGYSATTVNQNMKGKIPDKDTKAVISAINDKFPNLAKEVGRV